MYIHIFKNLLRNKRIWKGLQAKPTMISTQKSTPEITTKQVVKILNEYCAERRSNTI